MLKWQNHKGDPQYLRTIVEELMALEEKINNGFQAKRDKILSQHGHGSIGGLSKNWKEKYWELLEERNQLIHPLWVDISEIWETLAQSKNKS